MTALLGVQGYSSFGQTEVHQQYVATPSPHAMSLAKFAITPVNLHNGTANVNVPICNLSGVNVSLNYQTSGIKVQDVAGPVGLGWTLNAGGAITRTVKGKPDDDATNGWCGTNKRGNDVATFINDQGNGNVQYLSNGDMDSEPDIFYFNVGGTSGKFVLTPEGVPMLLPHQDIKIAPAIGSQANQNYWIITTANGTQYYFGKTSNAIEESEISTSLPNSQPQTYVSSWYLSEIITPNKKRIAFTYHVGNDVTYKTYYESVKSTVFSNAGGNEVLNLEGHQTVETIIKTKSTKTIAQITTEDGSIAFTLNSSTRFDLIGARSIQQVVKKNKAGAVLKTFNFHYSYYINGPAGSPVSAITHLKLVSLQEEGLPPYKFSYDTQALPFRNSFQIDHWGYFNNNAYRYNGKYSAILPYTNPTSGVAHPGANRSVDPVRIQAGILKKITYPTGGHTAYEYEPNRFLDGNGQEILGGGLRIKKMTIHDGLHTSKDQVYHYTYIPEGSNQTSGVLNGWYPYTYHYYIGSISGNSQGLTGSTSTFIRHSNPLTFWSNGLNSIVGYSSVTVKQTGNGKKVYRYRTFSDSPDIKASKYHYYYNTVQPDYHTTLTSDKPPFTPPSTRFWQRGQLLEEKTYDESGNIRNRKTQAFNTRQARGSLKALTGTVVLSSNATNIFTMNYGVYELLSEEFVLTSTTNTDYTDNQVALTTTTNYTYNGANLHMLPNQVETIHPDGSRTMQKMLYPLDYSDRREQNPSTAVLALSEMRTYHIKAAPIETTVWAKSKASDPLVLQKGTINEYKVNAQGVVNLDKTFNFEHTTSVNESGYDASNTNNYSTYKPDIRYQETGSFSYDDNQHLVAFNKDKGVKNAIIWGEVNRDGVVWKTTRPVAEISNANFDQVGYASFESYTSGSFSGIGIAHTENVWLYYGTFHNQDFVTGQQSFQGTMTMNVNYNQVPIQSGEYYLTYWAKGGGNVTVNGASQSTNAHWQHYKTKLTLGTNGSITINTGATRIDEVRLYPVGAFMKTYTYKDGVGISSVNGPQNNVMYYEYDANNRLKLIKDQNRNIIKKYEYYYKTSCEVSDISTVANYSGINYRYKFTPEWSCNQENFDKNTVKIHWRFNDGTEFDNVLGNDNGSIVHNFPPIPGAHTVTVTKILSSGEEVDQFTKVINTNGLLTFNTTLTGNNGATFTLNHTWEASGRYEYLWEFGDGTVKRTTKNFISHSYTSSGNFKVKVTLRDWREGTVFNESVLTVVPIQ